jgi:hypothetical protein
MVDAMFLISLIGTGVYVLVAQRFGRYLDDLRRRLLSIDLVDDVRVSGTPK